MLALILHVNVVKMAPVPRFTFGAFYKLYMLFLQPHVDINKNLLLLTEDTRDVPRLPLATGEE